jgi:NADH-quinone oxidoreductase subunit A
VVALIFLIFDVEVVLLIPWALVYKEFGLGGFIAGAVFLFLLGLGMVYEWRKGDLEWTKPKIVPPVISKDELPEEKSIVEEIKPEAIV